MDLATLNLHEVEGEGVEMPLLHPGTGEETGVTFRVIGYDTEAVEAAGREARNALMNGRAKTDQSEAMAKIRAARARAALVDVKGGSGSTKTVEDFRKLMGNPGFVWIVEQVEAFAGNRASFFTSAETP
ncbi:hypothetical protein [uncultured Mameliella sp.]|uniref:hypothetical protein n=1 Tax=uncultured Mameliella sp. TaxID=1447087 RepID=UPI0026096D58|nr:hypothetical protein [uncultured Mameliella sp.]